MSYYHTLAPSDLSREISELEDKLAYYRSQNLQLNMARGKPSVEQVNNSKALFDVLTSESDFIDEGVDALNYGAIRGIPSAINFFAELLGALPEEVFVGGSSSLILEYDLLVRGLMFGVLDQPAQIFNAKRKFLCPAPGYDRHFKIAENLGYELIYIPMGSDGPDMDAVEEAILDEDVKGIWIVPKYSNPSGVNFSEECMQRFARLSPAAKDFRIYCDNAYAVHDFDSQKAAQVAPLLNLAKAYNNEDLVYMFASTSKMTIPGAGVSAFACSDSNMQSQLSLMKAHTISYDKVNMLRHVRFFKDLDGIKKHMDKQATFLIPKFDLVDTVFHKNFDNLDLATWNKPEGGYFISLYTEEAIAKELVQLCKELGVVLTSAGSSFPYGKDPHNSHVRICPTYPSLDELAQALDVICTCVKYLSARKAEH